MYCIDARGRPRGGNMYINFFGGWTRGSRDTGADRDRQTRR